MNYNLSEDNEAKVARQMFDRLLMDGRLIELSQIKKTRSSLQNRSLHLFFTMISDELNDIGQSFVYQGLKGMDIETRFTPYIVKSFVWKPIQFTLFNTDSTTKLDTIQLDMIVEIIIKYFGDKGISLSFPSFQTLINKQDESKNI